MHAVIYSLPSISNSLLNEYTVSLAILLLISIMALSILGSFQIVLLWIFLCIPIVNIYACFLGCISKAIILSHNMCRCLVFKIQLNFQHGYTNLYFWQQHMIAVTTNWWYYIKNSIQFNGNVILYLAFILHILYYWWYSTPLLIFIDSLNTLFYRVPVPIFHLFSYLVAC